MKRILLIMAVMALGLSACQWIGSRRIKGNGNLETEVRSINRAEKISLSGSFDVQLTQGPVTSVKIEADDNLLPYIETDESDGVLRIRTRRNTNFSTEHNITVYITTPRLEQVHISGSGNVIGKNKFTEADKVSLKISGSGDIQLDLNTPELSATISGSGSMVLSGETRSQTIKIAGQGDYKAEELKSEKAKVSVAGSGDIRLYADEDLDVSIAGSGSVFYKGSASIKQHIVGSGEIKKIE